MVKEKGVVMRKFSIPVKVEMWGKAEVIAESIEEALDIINKNPCEYVPDVTELEYLGDSVEVVGSSYSTEDTVKYLRDNWDLSGGITGEEL